jgi:hypothetical protein
LHENVHQEVAMPNPNAKNTTQPRSLDEHRTSARPSSEPTARNAQRDEAAHRAATVDAMARHNMELTRRTRRGAIGPVGRIALLVGAMALVALAVGWIVLAALTP